MQLHQHKVYCTTKICNICTEVGAKHGSGAMFTTTVDGRKQLVIHHYQDAILSVSNDLTRSSTHS